MTIFNPKVLLNLIHEAPGRGGQTTRLVADRMGVCEKKLSREMNPFDKGAKIGVPRFVYLMAETDLAPLDYIEKVFNRVAVPIPKAEKSDLKTWLSHIEDITKETGEAVSKLAAAMSNDGEVDEKERAECCKEAYEGLQALAALYVHLCGKHKAE